MNRELLKSKTERSLNISDLTYSMLGCVAKVEGVTVEAVINNVLLEAWLTWLEGGPIGYRYRFLGNCADYEDYIEERDEEYLKDGKYDC